jgi:hypothetical protein
MYVRFVDIYSLPLIIDTLGIASWDHRGINMETQNGTS